MRDLKISVNYKLSEGKNTYNLRYTYDEEQLQQLALYAFDRANHPVINPDIVKIYEEWRTGYNKTNQVNAEVEEFFNRPKWMLIVSKDPEVSEALPMELKANTRYLVGATRGEEVVVPFQMYNSLDDLPKEIHDSLIVSLMMLGFILLVRALSWNHYVRKIARTIAIVVLCIRTLAIYITASRTIQL